MRPRLRCSMTDADQKAVSDSFEGLEGGVMGLAAHAKMILETATHRLK